MMLAAGAALYYGLLQLFLSVKGLELLSYLGMSQLLYPIPTAPHPTPPEQFLQFLFCLALPVPSPLRCWYCWTFCRPGVLSLFTALTRRSLWSSPGGL